MKTALKRTLLKISLNISKVSKSGFEINIIIHVPIASTIIRLRRH